MSSLSPEAVASLRKPSVHSKVYRDECMFSFATPETDGGLFINLTTYQAFSSEYVELDRERTGNTVYLHAKWKRVPKAEAAAAAGGAGGAEEDGKKEEKKPTVFGVGVEGGFQTEDSLWEYEKTHQIAVFPGPSFTPYPGDGDAVPEHLKEVVEAVLNHQDAAVEDTTAGWVDEARPTVHADILVQLEDPPKVSPNPKDWKCALCDKCDNLWMNLSDGFMACGRRQLDGSGGNGHALQHYEETGKRFPLCVKLGTITPAGGDVYSYDPEEDDMVEDKNLAKHLAHFGLNIMQLEKTEKSMAEVNIEANQQFEWGRILESDGKELEPRKGAGFVGLCNLGNSCYMNSTLQVLLSLPEVRARYFDPAQTIFRTAPEDPAADLVTQMAKVAVGVLSDKYVHGPPADGEKPVDDDVKPGRFRALVGKGHPEFSTGAQQDVQEYFLHLLSKMERAERTATDPGHAAVGDVSKLFKFTAETRLVDDQSGKVRYTTAGDSNLSLAIPMSAVTNSAEVEAYELEAAAKKQRGDTGSAVKDVRVLPKVPFDACLSAWRAEEKVGDFQSPVTGERGTATKTLRFKTFPRYLFVHLRKYILGEDWTPKKLEVSLDMPRQLDLESLRGTGLQSSEEELPEAASAPAAAGPTPDDAIVMAVVSMGFSENAGKRAAIATNNAGAEAATNWVLGHMEDPDLNDPLPAPGASSGGGGSGGAAEPDAAAVATLTSFGFTPKQAAYALGQTSNSLERAADWLMSHPDDLAAIEAGAMDGGDGGGGAAGAGGDGESKSEENDGPGSYELVGFISHLGRNTGSGHYVAHVYKDGKWTLFNDSKVAVSESPPFDLGYCYLYRRKD